MSNIEAKHNGDISRCSQCVSLSKVCSVVILCNSLCNLTASLLLSDIGS